MRGVALVIGVWTAMSLVLGPFIGMWLRRAGSDLQETDVRRQSSPQTIART